MSQRSGRERTLLGVALGFVVIWLAFAGIWQPLRQQRSELEARIARYERGLAILENPAFLASEPLSIVDDGRPVPVVLTDSAKMFQIIIRRLEAEGTGARVVLEEAPFEQVILWLQTLGLDHGLKVIDLEMTRRPAPGVVTTTVALER